MFLFNLPAFTALSVMVVAATAQLEPANDFRSQLTDYRIRHKQHGLRGVQAALAEAAMQTTGATEAAAMEPEVTDATEAAMMTTGATEAAAMEPEVTDATEAAMMTTGATEVAVSTTEAAATQRTKRFRKGKEKKKLKVMTRNMYVGFNLNTLFVPDAGPDNVLQEFQSTRFDLRAEALALEICSTQPDLIGLQEVTTISVAGVDFGHGPGEPLKFLDCLMPIIFSTCGMSYSALIVSDNTAFGPLTTSFGETSVLDQDAILLNGGNPYLEVAGTATDHYDAKLQFQLPDEFGGDMLTFPRSWQYVDFEYGGAPFRFANTHLETSAPFFPGNEGLNNAQAQEFIDDVAMTTPDDHGLIAVGDFNCVPGSDAYKILTGVLYDSWTEVNDDDEGFTCCEASKLDNAISKYTARIDHVFFGHSDHFEIDAKTADITGLEHIQAEAPYWASDHAGVVSSFEMERSSSSSSDVSKVA